MGNLRTIPPSDYEAGKASAANESFDIQCAGRGDSIERVFNYTSPRMVKKVNEITDNRFFRRKPPK